MPTPRRYGISRFAVQRKGYSHGRGLAASFIGPILWEAALNKQCTECKQTVIRLVQGLFVFFLDPISLAWLNLLACFAHRRRKDQESRVRVSHRIVSYETFHNIPMHSIKSEQSILLD